MTLSHLACEEATLCLGIQGGQTSLCERIRQIENAC